ncbi:RHS repeat-associated core domain-containing protein, partial [Metapseudomonas resinovorans]|uniref:RHS repeat-associated core domain-containing protein n=1 Tax=Metapseudomonas resinovorans TaxID=53412 RepID=UPI0023049FDB
LLELDQAADLLTLEEYFPFGGTAVWTGKSLSETQYKFVRYSGKERDATGLYYYGFRYYLPWLGRWLNPDPAGTVDGLNLFQMVGNNPITFLDSDGLAKDTLVVFTQTPKQLGLSRSSDSDSESDSESESDSSSESDSETSDSDSETDAGARGARVRRRRVRRGASAMDAPIAKVANGFFSKSPLSDRVIGGKPFPFEKIPSLKGEDIRAFKNLVLIGHGTGKGAIKVGKEKTLNLNKVNLPIEITSKVERIFLLHCSAGIKLDQMAEQTLLEKDAWFSLKSISANAFYNNWQSMGDVIIRKGWKDDPNPKKDPWEKVARNLLSKESGSGRSLNDIGLMKASSYTPSSVLLTEGYHRTYNVHEKVAKFSYAQPVMKAIAKTPVKTPTRGAPAPRGGRR